jgi:anti-anti-sigma regulatory factor
MANDRSKQDGGSGKVKRVAGAPAEPSPRKIVVQAERSGDWMPVDELRAAALAALEAGDDVSLHLDGIDHLDSSALQILLAFDADQKKQGRHLELANASPHLRQWFEYAGVPDHFSMTVPKTDD